MVEMRLDRLNVNDDAHVLQSWLVSDGASVIAGQVIAVVETSKAAVELEAASGGKIVQVANAGSTVAIGELLCLIEADGSAATSRLPAPTTVESTSAIIREDSNTGNIGSGLTTTRPYLTPRLLPLQQSKAASVAGEMPSQPTPTFSSRKLHEVANLAVVNPSGLVSCLFRDVRTGKRSNRAESIFKTNNSDLIVYEASHVLARYPQLNARFDAVEGVHYFDAIRFGYSIDVDDDLAVYNLGDPAKMNLLELRARIEHCIEAHVMKRTQRSMTEPTTITLTDLSGAQIQSFVPLINGAQSCIIGYSQPSAAFARLSLAFDHRVTSGKYAARFLDEVAERIESHFVSSGDFVCYWCGTDADTAGRKQERGLLRIVTSKGEDALCCPVCFLGF